MPTQEHSLGHHHQQVQEKLQECLANKTASRIWRKDPTLWLGQDIAPEKSSDIKSRLGWLACPLEGQQLIAELQSFAQKMQQQFQQVVLLGMGGSSLAPEVLVNIFGQEQQGLPLFVLDSTTPEAVKQIEQQCDLTQTLFVVSSKSGGTIETLSFFQYFYHLLAQQSDNPGQHFIAITDPGSPLEKVAQEKNFQHTFLAPRDVGGRYSVLTVFGLVPAALIGCDLQSLLASAIALAKQSQQEEESNQALVLGCILGEMAQLGRNKLSLIISPKLKNLGDWIEQLVAESTGKQGKGILPVIENDLIDSYYYSQDRVFVYLSCGSEDSEQSKLIEELEKNHHPVVRIHCSELNELGGEFFRWEMATAVAGALLHIDPFDQPDVELAKRKARQLMKEYEEQGQVPSLSPICENDQVALYGSNQESASENDFWPQLLQKIEVGSYIALMAYLPPTEETSQALRQLRVYLQKQLKIPVTIGFGPRFLHSTGQLHKGDNNQGIFIQLTYESDLDLPVPDRSYSFRVLVNSQALGDYQALEEKQRKLARVHFKQSVSEGLAHLQNTLEKIF